MKILDFISGRLLAFLPKKCAHGQSQNKCERSKQKMFLNGTAGYEEIAPGTRMPTYPTNQSRICTT